MDWVTILMETNPAVLQTRSEVQLGDICVLYPHLDVVEETKFYYSVHDPAIGRLEM